MYMLILILFYSCGPGVPFRCFYLMFHPPLPLSQLLPNLIPLSPALPRPFPTPGLEGAAHVSVVKRDLFLFFTHFLTFSDNAFIYSCLICLFFRNACSCFSKNSVKAYLIFRYISLKIRWLFTWLSIIHISLKFQWTFSYFCYYFELSNAVICSCIIVELY